MGLPSSLVIAVVSYNDVEISSSVAAIVGKMNNYPAPTIVPCCIISGYIKSIGSEIIKAGEERGLHITESIRPTLLDPRQISFWLILDNESEIYIRRRIESGGPRRQDFYQGAFPDPVVHCGFQVPSCWKHNNSYEPWFDELTTLFTPWKERLWEVFCNSS